MPRRAVPVGRLLALTVTALVAMTGSSLANDTAARQRSGTSQPAGDAGIRTTATGCGRGSGAQPNPHGQPCVAVTASGFLGGELVLVREYRRPGWQLTLRADGRGQVAYRLTPSAAHTPKGDVLTFVGLGASSPAGTAGTVQVSVPRIAVYRFGGV
jgi:hypothetical protein